MSCTSPGRILPIIGWDLSQHNGWEAGFDRSRSICPRLRSTRSIKKLIFQPPLTTWLKRQKLVLVPQITLDSNHSWPPQWVYSLLTKTHARVYGNRRSNTAINKVSSIISTISWFQTIPHSHTFKIHSNTGLSSKPRPSWTYPSCRLLKFYKRFYYFFISVKFATHFCLAICPIHPKEVDLITVIYLGT